MGKRTKTLLIVAAVLLVCCFGGAVGNGRGEGTGGSGSRNGFVDFLAERTSGAATVPDADVQAPCRTGPATFQFAGACQLTVAAGGAGLRSLVLRAETPIHVSSRVPGKDFAVSEDAEAGDEVRIPVDEQGGPVTLTCPPLSECLVRLENGQ